MIESEKLVIGKNVFIDETASIKGLNGKAKSIIIGDNTFIGKNVQIICDEFEIGDYGKIHNHTTIHGYKGCKIGHNAWIGQFTIIDCIGGTTIGNNCGIGAHSQLWSHIKFGDTLEGCRFNSSNELKIGNDVWFVGHCIVYPIIAEDKSMALAGSVVTNNMLSNVIYAGTPAKSISEKLGFQFQDHTIDDKHNKIINYLNDFGEDFNRELKVVKTKEEININDKEK